MSPRKLWLGNFIQGWQPSWFVLERSLVQRSTPYIPGQPQPQLIRDIHSSEVAPNRQGVSSIHWYLSKGFSISVEVWMGCRSGLPSLLNPCFLVMPSVMSGDFSYSRPSPGTLETTTTVPHSTNLARPMSLLCVSPIGAHLLAITVATIRLDKVSHQGRRTLSWGRGDCHQIGLWTCLRGISLIKD